MTNILLIALIILLYSLQTLFCTRFNDKFTGEKALASPVFNVVEGFVIAFATLCFIGFRFAPSPLTLLIGCLNAVALFVYNTSVIKASERGSYSFMCLAYLFGAMLIPLIVVSFIEKPITLLQWLCVGGVLVSFVLINIETINLHGAPLSYYVFCTLAFVSNGAYGTFVKMQSMYRENESQQMIVITFFVAGVIALVSLLVKEKGHALHAFAGCRGRAMLPLVGCLVVATTAINAFMYILPLIDLAVLNPSVDGGVLLVSSVFGGLVYKEKFTPLKTLGLLLAIAMIVTLNILGTT